MIRIQLSLVQYIILVANRFTYVDLYVKVLYILEIPQMIIMLQIIFSQLTIVLDEVSMVLINELKNFNSHKKFKQVHQ